MPLNLNELLKKAEKKGIRQNPPPSSTQILRPWQQESALYNHDDKLIDETGSKLVANREQSGSKLGSISRAKCEQTDSKVGANREQSGSTTGSTTGSKLVANREQSGSKLKRKITFSELAGLQREIVIFICHECKNIRSKVTDALTLEYLAKSLKRNPGVVKNAIGRLEKKNCLIRIGFKNGRGGWSRYEVSDHVYHDALRAETGSKPIAKWEQTESKVVAQPVAQPVANPSSSSSSNTNHIKTTTTELDDEWNFDITPYKSFGFTQTQLKQIATLGVISAANTEQSLIEFLYDLDNSMLPQIKTTKINFLMGLFRSGNSYVSEGFKNEQEQSIAEMARRSEAKRKQALEDKFLAWVGGLNDTQRNEIRQKLTVSLWSFHNTSGIEHPEIRKAYWDYFIQNVC